MVFVKHTVGRAQTAPSFLEMLGLRLAMAGGFISLGIMAVVCYEVFMRYFMNKPTGWSVEISEYMLLAVVYLGAAYTFSTDGHIKVDLVIDRVPARAQRILGITSDLFTLFFCAVLAWQTGRLTWQSFTLGWRSSSQMAISLYPFQAIVALGSLFLALQVLAKLCRTGSRMAKRKNLE
jgi:TRAP-type C4-dicarboxylate transport system permease small subunit